jgi:hypothetical protein
MTEIRWRRGQGRSALFALAGLILCGVGLILSWAPETEAAGGSNDAGIFQIMEHYGPVSGGQTITVKGKFLPDVSTSQYVQNGLIFHFDAINNLGTGDANHSTTTDTWVNLAPTGSIYDGAICQGLATGAQCTTSAAGGWYGDVLTFDEGTAVFVGGLGTQRPVDLAATQAFTLESSFRATGVTTQRYIFSDVDSGGVGLYLVPETGTGLQRVTNIAFINGAYQGLNSGTFVGNTWHTVSATYGGGAQGLTLDGVKSTPVTRTGVLTNNVSGIGFMIGGNPGYGYTSDGEQLRTGDFVSAARLYNRTLGDREVRFNQAIDKARFGAGASMVEWAATAGFEIDGNVCTNLTVVNDSTITCTTPAGSAGAKATEFTMAGDSFGLADYTYVDTFVNITADSALALSGAPDQLISGNVVVNTITNNPDGYSLTIETTNTNLVCATDSAAVIPAGSGTLNNTWGYGVGASLPSVWTGITTSPVEIKNFGTATNLTLGDDTRVWFGAQVDISKPACQYRGTVRFTAVAN